MDPSLGSVVPTRGPMRMRPRPIARHLAYATGSESMELSAITLRLGRVMR